MVLHVHQGSWNREIRIWLNEVMKLFRFSFSFFFDRLPEVISCFSMLFFYFFFKSISFSLWMHFGHPYSTPQSLSDVWAAVWGLLVTMAYHVSGIVWGFIKPRSWEIWTNQICANMPLSLSGFYVYSYISECFFFYSNPISFSIIILQKEMWSTRAWQAGQLLRNILANRAALCATPAILAARSSVSLICNYFLVDQFIYV